MKVYGLFLIGLLSFSPLITDAQTVIEDSSRIDLKVKHTLVPITLATAGLVTQGKISRHLQRDVLERYPDFKTRADDFVLFAPTALQFGLASAGVEGRHSLGEQVLLFVASNIITSGFTQCLKWISGYPRPDGDGYDAFPSGHTTVAFTNATLLHEEYGHRSAWYSVGGYTAASAVGTMRILNNRHWLADVLFGAGVGIGGTKGTYLVYPWLKHKVQKRKTKKGAF